MATTAMEARNKVCLLVLVHSHGNPPEKCRPEECSAWSWEDGCNECGIRLGHCALAGDAARSRPRKRKIRARRTEISPSPGRKTEETLSSRPAISRMFP